MGSFVGNRLTYNPKQLKKKSKFLSAILRHKPELVGVKLDKNGWCDVEDLLKRASGLTADLLDAVVETNNKKRFEFDENKTKIRARQGHSVDVDLNYEPAEPPQYLYHGTALKYKDKILKGGIKKMSRHAVHLSSDTQTAYNVGSRHGKPMILVVCAKSMHESCHKFYLSNNGVWLTDHVPPSFLFVNGE
jgi:putative RNA 2'-phosphotransferase